MATKRLPKLDHTRILIEIDSKIESDDWQERLSSIDLILDVYGDVPKERTVDQLVQRIELLTVDKKWEIRKASIIPLLELRRPGVRNALERLLKDQSRWVRKSAKNAKKKLIRITNGDNGAGFTYEAARRLGGSSAEKIFRTALKVGEKHYQEFAAEISHELNTYNAVVQNLLHELEYNLDGSGLSRRTAEIISKVQEQSSYLQRLVDDLLVYTRDADLEFEWVPVRSIVDEALTVALRKTHESLGGRDVDTHIQIPRDLEVEVCRERFCRALTNFVSNALEAMADKDDDLQLQIFAGLNELGLLRLDIVDTGRGMDATQLEDAKKRFSSGRKGRGGIGLGLPLAIKIIEVEHGGQLDITSQPGIGTNIVILLSLEREKKDELQSSYH